MFERFSAEARHAVEFARVEARHTGNGQIGCGHLLIGLAHERSGAAVDALAAAGLDLPRLRELAPRQAGAAPLDADSLALLGIALDDVRRAAEAAFGPGALDHPSQSRTAVTRSKMTEAAKKALELALRAAQATHANSLTAGHVLIGLIDQGDNEAVRMITSAGADPAALRADTQRRLAAAA